MHKMLAIAVFLMLGNAAWAADMPDRAKLSYDENAIINRTCASALKQGVGPFNACVQQQLVALRDHPTPDRSGLSPSRNHAVERVCADSRLQGIAPYNDCLRKAMAAPQKAAAETVEDELTPNYAQAFTESSTDEPAVTPVAAKSLPSPSAALPKRPDRIAKAPLTPKLLYKKVAGSVFVVLATRSVAEARQRNLVQGSAVAVSEHLLLTNCHVVKDRPLIKLVQEGKPRGNATLVASDDASDRCVIRTGLTLAPVAGVRTLQSLEIGERVFAIGAPLSQERTLSDGLVSAIRNERSRNLVQTSAAISPGSSGGGLFDEYGNLVGITTLGSRGAAQNLNCALAAADWWK